MAGKVERTKKGGGDGRKEGRKTGSLVERKTGSLVERKTGRQGDDFRQSLKEEKTSKL